MAGEQIDGKAITEGRFSESIVVAIVTLIASWVGSLVGDSLLAGSEGHEQRFESDTAPRVVMRRLPVKTVKSYFMEATYEA